MSLASPPPGRPPASPANLLVRCGRPLVRSSVLRMALSANIAKASALVAWDTVTGVLCNRPPMSVPFQGDYYFRSQRPGDPNVVATVKVGSELINANQSQMTTFAYQRGISTSIIPQSREEVPPLQQQHLKPGVDFRVMTYTL